MANEGYHEPVEELSDETRDMHRAIVSLMEELDSRPSIGTTSASMRATTRNSPRSLRTTATRRKSMPRWCSNGSGAATRVSTRN